MNLNCSWVIQILIFFTNFAGIQLRFDLSLYWKKGSSWVVGGNVEAPAGSPRRVVRVRFAPLALNERIGTTRHPLVIPMLSHQFPIRPLSSPVHAEWRRSLTPRSRDVRHDVIPGRERFASRTKIVAMLKIDFRRHSECRIISVNVKWWRESRVWLFRVEDISGILMRWKYSSLVSARISSVRDCRHDGQNVPVTLLFAFWTFT